MSRPKSLIAIIVLLWATNSIADEIVVKTTLPDSPAASAGIEAGDRIVAIGDRPIATHEDLKGALAAHRAGDTISFFVQRNGEPVELKLTFGERSDGGPSIGAMLAIATTVPAGNDGSDAERVACPAWLESTYRIDSSMEALDLEWTEDREAIRACVVRDSRQATLPATYCDNIFKIHCSGLDLLADIAEAQLQRCERQLGESLDVEIADHKSWKTCATNKLFDRYSSKGQPIDEPACKTAFIEECGADLD